MPPAMTTHALVLLIALVLWPAVGLRTCRHFLAIGSQTRLASTPNQRQDSTTTSSSESESESESLAASARPDQQKYVNPFEELSEDERDEVLSLALGEEHFRELPLKVKQALEEDYDEQAGVNPSSRPLPLKANTDLWTYQARQAMLSGDFKEAERIYNKCVEYNPVDGRPWLGLARIAAKRGLPEVAEKSYKDGLYYNPKNPFLLQSWAVMLEKQGRVPEASRLLTRSIKSNPTHAASWVALARIHQRQGRLDEARFCFSSAVDSDPRSYVALQAWGVLEAQQGSPDIARGLFSRAVKASGTKSVHALQAWATLERRQGNLDEARRLLERAGLPGEDDGGSAGGGAGGDSNVNGNSGSRKRDGRKGEISSRIRLSAAELCELRGDGKGARREFEAGATTAAGCGDAGFFQSWALFEARTEEAEARARDARVTDSDKGSSGSTSTSTSTRTSAGTTAAANGAAPLLEPTAARLLFKRAVTVNKFHSASWVAWAKYEQRRGNLEVARKLLVTGISHFPHSRNAAWFHCSLGQLAAQTGDINTARSCYDRALQASPPQSSLSILLEFSRMEDQLGSVTSARKLLDRAVKLHPMQDRAWDAFLDFERRHSGGPRMENVRYFNQSPQMAANSAGVSTDVKAGAVVVESDVVSALKERRATEQTAASLQLKSKEKKLSALSLDVGTGAEEERVVLTAASLRERERLLDIDPFAGLELDDAAD